MNAADLRQLARHNVRVLSAVDLSREAGVAVSPASAFASGWTTLALAAERVGERLAGEVAGLLSSWGGAGATRPGGAPGECRLVLRATGPDLARLILTLPQGRGPEAAALAAAVEHAWNAYRAARLTPPVPQVMGIVNVTPDSFNPVGRYPGPGAAAEHGLRLAEEGADLLDVGGESTRPGAAEVSAEEELARVLPVVERLVRETAVPVSVDTTKAEVAARCLDAGARWINDISGLTFDPGLAAVAARAGATLVLMHIQGTPRTMQQNPVYEDVVADTLRFLRERVAVAVEAGVPFEDLVIDPGFGFGKTVAHNLEILRRLREYTSAGLPLLAGTSRKSTIGHVLGGLPPEERLEGTAATVAAAVLHGAAILRVHDVQAMRRVVRMAEAMRGG